MFYRQCQRRNEGCLLVRVPFPTISLDIRAVSNAYLIRSFMESDKPITKLWTSSGRTRRLCAVCNEEARAERSLRRRINSRILVIACTLTSVSRPDRTKVSIWLVTVSLAFSTLAIWLFTTLIERSGILPVEKSWDGRSSPSGAGSTGSS